MIDDPKVEAGRETSVRLRERERKSWQDWLQVGYALQIGRSAALQAAGTNAPFGKVYTKFKGEWLRANQLDDIGQQVRYRLLQCVENIVDIEKWRSSLDEQHRLKYDYRDSCWHNWRRSTATTPSRCADPKPRPQWIGGSRTVNGSYHRPVHLPEALRRAHRAMHDSQSRDLLVLERCALEGAVRDEADLLALLSSADTPEKSGSQRSVEIDVAEPALAR